MSTNYIKGALQGLRKLSLRTSTLSVLRSLLDPAFVGSPYDTNRRVKTTRVYAKENFVLFRKKFSLR